MPKTSKARLPRASLMQVELPPELDRTLRADAKANYRTIKGQLVAILTDYYENKAERDRKDTAQPVQYTGIGR